MQTPSHILLSWCPRRGHAKPPTRAAMRAEGYDRDAVKLPWPQYPCPLIWPQNLVNEFKKKASWWDVCMQTIGFLVDHKSQTWNSTRIKTSWTSFLVLKLIPHVILLSPRRTPIEVTLTKGGTMSFPWLKTQLWLYRFLVHNLFVPLSQSVPTPASSCLQGKNNAKGYGKGRGLVKFQWFSTSDLDLHHLRLCVMEEVGIKIFKWY